MQNTITKKILEIEDVNEIKPNFDILKIISKKVAENVQALVFDVE